MWGIALWEEVGVSGENPHRHGGTCKLQILCLIVVCTSTRVFQLSGDHREELKGPKSRIQKTTCTPKTCKSSFTVYIYMKEKYLRMSPFTLTSYFTAYYLTFRNLLENYFLVFINVFVLSVCPSIPFLWTYKKALREFLWIWYIC